MKGSTVTMSEIAEAAGVSRVTVSNILNGRTRGAWRSSARQVERVKALAREMGYRPHTAAKATATGRFGAVALLTRWDVGSNHFSVSKAFAATLGGRGVHTHYGIVPQHALHDPGAAPRLLRELCVDGLVVDFSLQVEPELVEMVHATGVPTIWINADLPHDCVRPDDLDGGRMAADALLRVGHRRIGCLVERMIPQQWHYSAQHRLSGAEAAVSKANGSLQRVIHPPLTRGLAELQAWRELLREHDDLTGWICRGSEIGSLYLAALSLGMQVPGDLSLVALGESGTNIGVPASVLGIPMYAVGERAAAMILEKIDDPTERLPTVVVPFREPGGATIAPPRIE